MAVRGLFGTPACLRDDGVDVLVCDGAASAAEDKLCPVAHHREQVVLAHGLVAVLHAPLLDDHGIQLQLFQRLLNHLQQSTALYQQPSGGVS